MALAVKNSPETASANLLDRLPVAIFAGVLYVVGSLAVVGKLLPAIWWNWLAFPPSFGSWTGLGVVLLATAAGLFYLGIKLLGPHPQHGARGGIFVGLIFVLLVLLLTRWASLWFEHWAYQGIYGPPVGIALTTIFGLVLLVGTARLFFLPGTERRIKSFEDQGWFNREAYKRSQGLLVRRGTIFGLLVITGCGIFTLLDHKTLDSGPKDWQIDIPFTGRVAIDKIEDAKLLFDGKNEDPTLLYGSLIPQDQQSYLITDPRDAKELSAGQFVSKQDFQELTKSLEEKKQDPPQGSVTVERYLLRDKQAELVRDYVKIIDLGDLDANKYSEGDILKKTDFEEAKKSLDEVKGREPPKAVAPQPPFGHGVYAAITVLPNVKFTLPIILAFGALWMSWRIVNLPVFADFLIATEAEMNKVSWTSRKRLMQDTIVVLTTVFLLTISLLIVDYVWYQLLSWKPVGVLQINKANKPEDSNTDRPN